MMDVLRKYSDLLVVAIVVLALVFYDVSFDLLVGLLHFLLERLHELFEWIELAIEHTVEHLFHTSRHGSQIVTFYVLVALIGFLAYRLWRVVPGLYRSGKEWGLGAWAQRKTELELYWLSLTLISKILLIGTALVVAYLASFFVM